MGLSTNIEPGTGRKTPLTEVAAPDPVGQDVEANDMLTDDQAAEAANAGSFGVGPLPGTPNDPYDTPVRNAIGSAQTAVVNFLRAQPLADKLGDSAAGQAVSGLRWWHILLIAVALGGGTWWYLKHKK